MSTTGMKTKLKWDPVPALQAAEDGQKDGLQAASDVVLAMANEHAPLDTGALIGSGRVDWNGEQASVYYDTVYAAKLHEDRRLHIKGGREGLWLKKAAMRSKPHVIQFFGDALKVRFRRRAVL